MSHYFGLTQANRVEMVRDHRPGMPEVALRFPSRMASCARHECAARTASYRRSLATGMCRTHRRAREYVSNVGQRIAARSAAHAAANQAGGDGARAEHRTLVARSTCARARRTPTHVTGGGTHRPAAGDVLVAVGIRPPHTTGDASRWPGVHAEGLPSLWRAEPGRGAASVSP